MEELIYDKMVALKQCFLDAKKTDYEMTVLYAMQGVAVAHQVERSKYFKY